MEPLTTSTITEDVQGSTVVVTFNGWARFRNTDFMFPSEVIGPFHSHIKPIPTHATTQYALESSELAALLTAFKSEWRPQHLSAPAPQLSTPAEYDAAVECLAAHPELPEGWYAFAQRARRHRDWLVGRVDSLGLRALPDELYLEVATTRKLCDEINKVFASWRLLSEAISAWETEHAESYFSQFCNWAKGSFKAVVNSAPLNIQENTIEIQTQTTVTPITTSATAPDAQCAMSSLEPSVVAPSSTTNGAHSIPLTLTSSTTAPDYRAELA